MHNAIIGMQLCNCRIYKFLVKLSKSQVAHTCNLSN